MLIKCTKIHAMGYYGRFATFEIDNIQFTCFIKDEIYQLLKKKGIPTAQKLRYERQK